MQFVPNYTVSYKGVFHRAGIPFEIAAEDCEEMSNHGTVQETPKKQTKKQPAKKEEE